MNLTQPLRLVAAFMVVASAAACGSSARSAAPRSSGPRAPSSPTSASIPSTIVETSVATITIKNFAFDVPIGVKAGSTVTVHNADDTAHTVSADDHSFDTQPIFAGTSVTFVAPTKAGSYPFHCNIHGVLTVTH